MRTIFRVYTKKKPATMATILCFTDAGKATTPAISTIVVYTPLHPASMDTAKLVVASRKMWTWAMPVSSKGKMMAPSTASSPIKG